MPLFKIGEDQRVTRLRRTRVSKERDIQKLCEANLETLFNIRFIGSEVRTGGTSRGRIDTLGIDENNCPVIIEYKKTAAEDILTQGLAYLTWLINSRGDFQVASEKALGSKVEVNWSRPRLLLIADSFTGRQIDAVATVGQAVDLKTHRIYHDDLLYIEDLCSSPAAAEQRKKEGKGRNDARESKWNLDSLLKGRPEEIKVRFDQLRLRILKLGHQVPIVEGFAETHSWYKADGCRRVFCFVDVGQNFLTVKLDIRPEELDDPESITSPFVVFSRPGGSPGFHLRPEGDIDYALSLIKQAYESAVSTI